MSSKYEFRIITPGRKKIIHFGSNAADWEEIFNSAAAVDGEEPDQFKENEVTIGKIDTRVPYKQAIETMISQAFLHDKLATILRNESEESDCKE
jgi:hypothetical protein